MRKLKYDRIMAITILATLATLGIALIVLSHVKQQLVATITDEYKEQQLLLADQIVETLSNNLVNIQNQLGVIATMPEVKNIGNPERCNQTLIELLQVNQKQLGNLGRTNPDAYFVCSVNPALRGQNSRQFGTYVSDLINDPEHKPVLGRMTKPPGTDSLAVGIHVPVYEHGSFNGTLGGAVYFSQFQDAYLKNITFGKSGHVVVMDDNGDILYHPSQDQHGKNLLSPEVLNMFEPQEAMRNLLKDVQDGKSGTFNYRVGGTNKIGLYKSFKIPNIERHWGVVVTIPSEDIDHVIAVAGVNRIFILMVLLLIFTIALLSFISIRNNIKNQELRHLKDEFVSITSHQLRTPATIVKQYLGLLRGGYAKNKHDRDKFVEAAYRSNEEQLNIIENILSVARLGAGHLEIETETVVVQDIVKGVVETQKLNIKSKKHKLSTQFPAKPVTLQADPIKLTMAIDNLVSNAVKYTPQSGVIKIKVKRQKDRVLILVQDNGPGIPEKEIPKLFKRFNRLDSAIADHIPGTGLGLYMAKKIVKLHGGTITVKASQKTGSIFTINLPVHSHG